jgi:hypothetical protein
MATRKRPCRFCRRWFQPDPRVGNKQYACSADACQHARQRGNERAWHERHPGYFRGREAAHRAWRRAHPDAQRERRAADPKLRERERIARRQHRREAPSRRAVEQKAMALQLLESQGVTLRLTHAGEQKAWRSQTLVLLGLATRLSPAGEHKSMEANLAHWHDHGSKLANGVLRHGTQD